MVLPGLSHSWEIYKQMDLEFNPLRETKANKKEEPGDKLLDF